MAFKGFLQLTAKTGKTQQGKETTCKLTQLYTHSDTDKLVTITQVGCRTRVQQECHITLSTLSLFLIFFFFNFKMLSMYTTNL